MSKGGADCGTKIYESLGKKIDYEFEKEYVTCDCESLPHIFVARDKNGDLYCFPDKPEKDETLGQYKGCGFFIPLIDNEIFKGITWETGPKILILKDVIEC